MAVCDNLFQLNGMDFTGFTSGLNSLAENGFEGSLEMSKRTVVAFGMLSAGYTLQLIGFASGSVNGRAIGGG